MNDPSLKRINTNLFIIIIQLGIIIGFGAGSLVGELLAKLL